MSVISTLVFGVYHAGLFAAILAGLWNGNINVADVVFYAGMGPALYFLMEEDFLNNIRRLFQLSVEFKRFREYTDYGENTGKTDIPVNRKTPVIEFQHVSFTYPGSDREVLKDINLVVEKGEKIAIVGVNGAGKTTLMKLTCGLLLPASGRILLDGKDMAQMEPEERYSWFSCAFQDIHHPVVLTGFDNTGEYTNVAGRIPTANVPTGLLGKRLALQLLFRTEHRDAPYELTFLRPTIIIPHCRK